MEIPSPMAEPPRKESPGEEAQRLAQLGRMALKWLAKIELNELETDHLAGLIPAILRRYPSLRAFAKEL